MGVFLSHLKNLTGDKHFINILSLLHSTSREINFTIETATSISVYLGLQLNKCLKHY
jgi:hypothetical protein